MRIRLSILAALLCAAAVHGASSDAVAATITVTDKGFEPAHVEVPADKTVVVTFRRTVENTCATAVVWSDSGIRHELPVGQEVRVSLRAAPGKAIAFACPMAMYTGEVTAKPSEPVAAADGTITVQVDEKGFHPDRIAVTAGAPTRLRFTRTSDSTCAKAVRIPKLGVADTDLPLGKPVEISITPTTAGEVPFTCPMEMVTGTIVIGAAPEHGHAP